MEPLPGVPPARCVFLSLRTVVTVRPAASGRAFGKSQRGFSLVELGVSVALLIILSAMAIPTLTRAYYSYVLSDAASQFSGMMKFTRFEAIRRNTRISCRVQQTAGTWTAWADTDKDGNPSAAEAKLILAGLVSVVPAPASPSTAPIVAAIGAASPAITVQSAGNTFITYDGRGGVDFGGNPPAVYVYFLGNTGITDFGSRAIVLLPSGSVQVWSSATGAWTRVG